MSRNTLERGYISMYYKFFLLQITGMLLLFAAFLYGIPQTILEADHTFAIPLLGGLTGIGLVIVLMAISKWSNLQANILFDNAKWLSDILPVVGLLGTVYGVLLAVKGIDGLSLDQARVYVFSHTADALVSNALGMFGYLWLRLTIKIVQG